MRNRKKSIFTGPLTCLLCTIFAAPLQASFIGTTAEITFSSASGDFTPLPIVSPFSFTDNITVGAGNEIQAGDATDIGSSGGLASAVPVGEYIDIGMDYIEFNIFGGVFPAIDCSLSVDCTATQLPADTTFLIDFSFDLLDLFEAPTQTTPNLVGVALGSELVIGASSISLIFGDVLIGAALGNFGMVRLDFAALTDPPDPPSVIPVPAALPLMLSGLALIGFIARRKKS